MRKVDELYCKTVKVWEEEQAKLILNCQENAASARMIADLNDKQAVLHKAVLTIGQDGHRKWLEQQSKKK